MRFVVALFTLVVVGCPGTTNNPSSIGDDDNPSGSASGSAECSADYECAAAAARCCDCPTFAAPRTDPTVKACLGVACPMMPTCAANVAPACRFGQCVLACVAMACPSTCDAGFALDASGCLSCTCPGSNVSECSTDIDCARVPADCCGCSRGGADTAVPVGDQAEYSSQLGCPPSPSCPGVDTCAAELTPTCVEGSCKLISGDLPAGACGRADLPACPDGEVCTVNVDDTATVRGLGVCVPAT